MGNKVIKKVAELRKEIERLRNDKSIKRMDESFEYTANVFELKGLVEGYNDALKDVEKMIDKLLKKYDTRFFKKTIHPSIFRELITILKSMEKK